MRVLAIAALLVALLAGCLEDGGAREVTAEQARPVADGVARQWDRDAQLVGVAGVDFGPGTRAELADELARLRQERLQSGHADDDARHGEALLAALLAPPPGVAGDGRTGAWTFGYESPDGQRFVVSVASGGIVFSGAVDAQPDEDEDDFLAPFGDAPLGTWRIGSDEAADLARDNSTEYAAARGERNATAFYILGADDDGADGPARFWFVAIEADEGGAFLLVDADDGTVVAYDELLADLFLGTREWGFASGRFDPGMDTTDGFGFELAARHRVLAVQVAASPPPVVPIQAKVTWPDGSEHTAELAFVPAAQADVPEATALLRFEDAPAGIYRVDLAAPLAAYQTWEGNWCTDGSAGFMPPFIPQPPACDHV